MLIARQPKLSWFINTLGILLLSLLIANSILGSIYINNLKNRMSDMTDNYFQAESYLQSALESIVQTRVNLLKLTLALQTADKESFPQIKTDLYNKFNKNQINLSSLLNSLKRKNLENYIQKPIDNLYNITNKYLLFLENLYDTQQSTDLNLFLDNSEKSREMYLEIREQLEKIADIIKEKAVELKDTDSIILQYFPPILFVSFFAALIIGGSLIYVSRRELRMSVLNQSYSALTEAYQYQQDSLQTLQVCQKALDNNIFLKNKFNDLQSRDEQNLEILEALKNLNELGDLIQSAFFSRINLHEIESKNIELTLQKVTELKRKV